MMYHASILALTLCLGSVAAQGSRVLLQEERFELLQGSTAQTYSSVKGQRPGGVYVAADRAAASSSGVARGIRYNAGKVITAGDRVPGPFSATNTGYGVATRSGNTLGEASVNLGTQAISATYEGARAVAGSAAHHTAAVGAAVSSNLALVAPRTVKNPGSVAFTDKAHTSAAVTGMGDGPVVIARGNEVSAMSRAGRESVVKMHRKAFDTRKLMTYGHLPLGMS